MQTKNLLFPDLGPRPGEADLEAMNRVYNRIRYLHYYSLTNDLEHGYHFKSST